MGSNAKRRIPWVPKMIALEKARAALEGARKYVSQHLSDVIEGRGMGSKFEEPIIKDLRAIDAALDAIREEGMI
jgi:hypothetical protein